ncbi:peptidase, S9A (prolyl oligopeptidase) family protein [Plesiocystis pacifica SIR-1]|uniref:prolyl oligopeptidase n=2 Tax=Plesiocystis pacifica TaxID=191768 RepID=A6G908_9BACT|nr:peptidase, S9A (prolyl oligopeptidase) family protein [Plesiocystis pacifica SIR-1]
MERSEMSKDVNGFGGIVAALGLSLGLGLGCAEPVGDSAPPIVDEAEDAAAEGPPVAEPRPVVDRYHEVEVVDAYRWLEDASDPEVQAWRRAQDAHAQRVLEASPSLAELEQRLTGIMRAPTVSHWDLQPRPSGIFAMRYVPPAAQPVLVLLPGLDDAAQVEAARVLVDPNAMDEAGLTHIDWVRPSPDGTKVAVSLSKAGSEVGDLHVFEVATGALVEPPIPRVNGGTAGGDLAWASDGRSFLYTRYPRAGERPEAELDKYVQVHRHTLGEDASADPHEFGSELPDIAEIHLAAVPQTGKSKRKSKSKAVERVLATIQYGDSGRFVHYLRDTKGAWQPLSAFDDGIVQVSVGGGELWFVDVGEASPRGRLLRASLDDPSKREVFVAEAEDTLTHSFWGDPSVEVVGDRVYARYQLGGPSELRAFDRRTGAPLDKPEQPAVGSAGSMVALGDALVFGAGSYLEPYAWRRHGADGETQTTALAEPTPEGVDYSGIEVRREFATSKDGTKVPVNILVAADAPLDGSRPCVVTGYGGYGISLTPGFSPARIALLERGFCYAVVNLRGGSEYGEAWHEQGARTNKQNVFDDFAAALEHLAARGYSQPERLGIIGGSNGGLLMGALLTQRPELVAAVIARVGIYDMLRNELSANGQYNIPEFGTVEDPEQFAALHAYSPYHHVEDGRAYPAVLFTTGANDPRVDPMQSRKMTARLQAATQGASEVLLRVSDEAGHGGGKPLSARIRETAEGYAFFVDRLESAGD